MKVIRPLIIDETPLAGEVLELLAALREKLSATVALQDLQRREAHTHIRMPDWWFSHASSPNEPPIGLRDADWQALAAPINWRWKLWAAPHTAAGFRVDAFALMVETAKKVARFLPAEPLLDAAAIFPAFRTGGPSAGR